MDLKISSKAEQIDYQSLLAKATKKGFLPLIPVIEEYRNEAAKPRVQTSQVTSVIR